MGKLLNGGWCAGKRKYVMGGVGLLSAFAAYLVGDSNIFVFLEAVCAFAGIYFLSKSNQNKGKQNG